MINKKNQSMNLRLQFAIFTLKFCADNLYEMLDENRWDAVDQQLEVYWVRVKTMITHLEGIYETDIKKEST